MPLRMGAPYACRDNLGAMSALSGVGATTTASLQAMNQDSRRPAVVDLFAGAGGLSLGFEMAGFDIVAGVEYDPIHAAAHELNFPRATVICQSVRDLDGEKIRTLANLGRRAIDVVVGGPPCQGFSLIGHRVLDD